MKTEDLLAYVENDDNFTPVDPFMEFVSGVSDDDLFILLLALGAARGMDETFMFPLRRRSIDMWVSAIKECDKRRLDSNGYFDELLERAQMEFDRSPE